MPYDLVAWPTQFYSSTHDSGISRAHISENNVEHMKWGEYQGNKSDVVGSIAGWLSFQSLINWQLFPKVQQHGNSLPPQ